MLTSNASWRQEQAHPRHTATGECTVIGGINVHVLVSTPCYRARIPHREHPRLVGPTRWALEHVMLLCIPRKRAEIVAADNHHQMFMTWYVLQRCTKMRACVRLFCVRDNRVFTTLWMQIPTNSNRGTTYLCGGVCVSPCCKACTHSTRNLVRIVIQECSMSHVR